jgi:ADP-ribosylglycohydrolase
MGDVDRALLSLAGLSVGDAFGEQFFRLPWEAIGRRELPPTPWKWTDDTAMALSIVEVLRDHRAIEQDVLAGRFAARFRQDPRRGYGGGAVQLLSRVAEGANWEAEAPRLFNGGSYGNGAAMRAGPIGGYFWGDPERAALEAQRSAVVTHSHLEGQAGAIAVAAAAALAPFKLAISSIDFLSQVIARLPQTRTREKLEEARKIGPDEHGRAVSTLGTGNEIAAFDTVPFCLWVAAYHGFDFETALWTTVAGGGDRDTTCAIVGSIVGLSADIPETWLRAREPLPAEFELGR